ncbi:MAG: hypothetical protein ACO1OX_08585 [Novosphingobium sp.]
MTKRSARFSPVSTATGRLRPLLASLALFGPALALVGCGKSSDDKLDARLAALEAKAEEADKRSRQALSMAATSNPAPMSDSGSVDPFGEPADSGEVTDGSPDSAIYDNTIEAPPAPPIMPEN